LPRNDGWSGQIDAGNFLAQMEGDGLEAEQFDEGSGE
jgi:hypothetical protein